MKKNTAVIMMVIALVVGHGIGYFIGNSGMHSKNSEPVVMNSASSMHGSMASMMVNLEGKTGDEFDKAFLSEMIMHHEGAVVMAEAALKNAKHQEIKSLAQAIIQAQNKEIADMQLWQKNWYGIETTVNSNENVQP
ncbi:DUF305 domain-containing protein [Patescibacteria group bacterium]|nr:DUF305 domain-containing protein [Patescibacteria group bacterium]